MKLIKDLSPEDKSSFGLNVNILKSDVSKAIDGSIGGKVEVVLNGKVLGSRNLYYEKVYCCTSGPGHGTGRCWL